MTWKLCIEAQRTWKVGDCPELCTRAEGRSSIAPRKFALRLRIYQSASRATHASAEARRVFRTDRKSNRAVSRNNVSFVHAPHTLDIGRILRALNRIRVELVSKFSLTIRRGLIYGSIKDLSCRQGRRGGHSRPGHGSCLVGALRSAGREAVTSGRPLGPDPVAGLRGRPPVTASRLAGRRAPTRHEP